MSIARPATTGPAFGHERGTRLRVDPTACDGIGLCALRAPDVVELDRWGYPVLGGGDLEGRGLVQARRAVRACPRHALWLVDDEPVREGRAGSPAR